jgi:hypothetical protein
VNIGLVYPPLIFPSISLSVVLGSFTKINRCCLLSLVKDSSTTHSEPFQLGLVAVILMRVNPYHPEFPNILFGKGFRTTDLWLRLFVIFYQDNKLNIYNMLVVLARHSPSEGRGLIEGWLA